VSKVRVALLFVGGAHGFRLAEAGGFSVLFVLELAYFIISFMASFSSLMVFWSPVRAASTMQCSMWSFRMISLVLFNADRTAASCVSTSAQPRPSSTMFFTASRWPIARESRLSTAFVSV